MAKVGENVCVYLKNTLILKAMQKKENELDTLSNE
jgi:hypothetical protein